MDSNNNYTGVFTDILRFIDTRSCLPNEISRSIKNGKVVDIWSDQKSFISPHPPIVVHEAGKGEERKAAATVGALQRLAQETAKIKPSTIIVTTPHGPVFQDYIFINHKKVLSGDFKRFGAADVKLSYETT